MEGFPAPDAKTIMEAMEDDESEKLVEVVCVPGGERSVGNSHDELELELELVGDVQLADDDEDNEEEDAKNMFVLRIKSIPVNEESTPVERGGRMAIKVCGRQVREEHKCRESERSADYGCNTVVPAVCCMNGFLREENHQQREDDCEKKLMVKGRSNLSCKERLLPRRKAALYSTGHRGEVCGVQFLVRFNAGIDHKLLSTFERERVDKSSQDIWCDQVEVGSLDVTVNRRDVKEAVTRTKQRVRRNLGMRDDFFGEYSCLLDYAFTVVGDAEKLAIQLKIDHDGKTADWRRKLRPGSCLTHFRFLLIEARKSDFGRNLLQEQIVSVNSNSDSLTIEVLCRGRTKVQRKILNGRSDESREVVRKKDDRRKRDEIVWKKNSEHSRWTESYADGAIYVVSAYTELSTKKSKECQRKSQAAERVAGQADPTDKMKESSKAPEKQKVCKRPTERSNEFETERSLERLLGGVIPSAQKPRKSGYARVRTVKIGMFSSSTAARRRTEISMRMLQRMLQDAVVVPTAKDGVEALAETSSSTADADTSSEAVQRRGCFWQVCTAMVRDREIPAERTQHTMSNEFEAEDPEVDEKEKQIGRRHLWSVCQIYKSQIRREGIVRSCGEGQYNLLQAWIYYSCQDEYAKELMERDGYVEYVAVVNLQAMVKTLDRERVLVDAKGLGKPSPFNKLQDTEKDEVQVEQSNIAIFYSSEHDARVLVHNDDLVLLGDDLTVTEFDELLKLRYPVKLYETGNDDESLLWTETQVAKPFVEQLGKDHDCNHGRQRDNHFGCSRESYKVIKLLRMSNEIDELDEKLSKMIQDKKTPRECDMKIGKIGFEDSDDDEASNIQIDDGKNTKREIRQMTSYVSMPDEAEGQRPNLSSVMNMTDMSKLSLGRRRHVQIVYLWMRELIAPDVTLKHFVLSKVGTLLNMADVLTKQ